MRLWWGVDPRGDEFGCRGSFGTGNRLPTLRPTSSRTITANPRSFSEKRVFAFRARRRPRGSRGKLTSYDAAYLELAIRLELPLVTSDQAVIRDSGRCPQMCYSKFPGRAFSSGRCVAKLECRKRSRSSRPELWRFSAFRCESTAAEPRRTRSTRPSQRCSLAGGTQRLHSGRIETAKMQRPRPQVHSKRMACRVRRKCGLLASNVLIGSAPAARFSLRISSVSPGHTR